MDFLQLSGQFSDQVHRFSLLVVGNPVDSLDVAIEELDLGLGVVRILTFIEAFQNFVINHTPVRIEHLVRFRRNLEILCELREVFDVLVEVIRAFSARSILFFTSIVSIANLP